MPIRLSKDHGRTWARGIPTSRIVLFALATAEDLSRKLPQYTLAEAYNILSKVGEVLEERSLDGRASGIPRFCFFASQPRTETHSKHLPCAKNSPAPKLRFDFYPNQELKFQIQHNAPQRGTIATQALGDRKTYIARRYNLVHKKIKELTGYHDERVEHGLAGHYAREAYRKNPKKFLLNTARWVARKREANEKRNP